MKMLLDKVRDANPVWHWGWFAVGLIAGSLAGYAITHPAVITAPWNFVLGVMSAL